MPWTKTTNFPRAFLSPPVESPTFNSAPYVLFENGVIHLTTHHLAFHASLATWPDLSPRQQVIRAGPAVIHCNSRWKRKQRVWMEISFDMLHLLEMKITFNHYRPFYDVLRVNPKHPKIVQVIFDASTTPSMNRIAEFDTAKAAKRKDAESTKAVIVQVDDLLTFRQFSKKSADDAIDYDEDVRRATRSTEIREDFISNLSCISQLTGFSDPIYAEAYVKMHGFDHARCSTHQPNFCLDFATLGDLKLVE
ncbi:hypothetical protein PILCRDRAFT_14465 [Piloderma croceum F 1598]|uniref:Coatomer beta subunit C-terminal domain-containing protein n=1 Tax=Piloderma croceum (strain F 1598) TaxID=765440 RepID=A0A0C3F3C5_PILCF|nr:hypothetical protein PILCRDRAFT_14465 [Piloderma croceum F 1598]